MSPPAPASAVKVILLGYGHLGSALLAGLLACPKSVHVEAVFRWSGRSTQAGYFDDAEKHLATEVRQLGIDDIRCEGANSYDFICELQRRKPDVLLIGSWGEILKPHILEFPDLTVINCHHSLLPAHRGANPYASVIGSGESQSGVTFHIASAGVDEGDIILQKAVPVYSSDTGGDLRTRCADTAQTLVPELIEKITTARNNNCTIESTPQNNAQASYYKPLTLEDARIHWQQAPETLYNQCRALQPWLDCFCYTDHKNTPRMIATKAITLKSSPHQLPAGTLINMENSTLWVASSQADTILGLNRYRLQLGAHLMPETLSGWLAPWLLKKGQILSSELLQNR